VFRVRALYYTKNINHQQMHKQFFINCNTLLHVSTLLGHLQGELSVVVTLRLHFIVERECAVDCVLHCFWRRELSVMSACTASRHHREMQAVITERCKPTPQRDASRHHREMQADTTERCKPTSQRDAGRRHREMQADTTES
jgi:hypothetical protein